MKKFKLFSILIAVVVLLAFIPFYPNALMDYGDPRSVNDERVRADITDDDLTEILGLARGGHFLSLYEYISLMGSEEIISINDSYNNQDLSRDKREKVKSSEGKVIVVIGYIFGKLCGSGVSIYLDKIDGKWVILESNHWIS